MVCSHLGGLHGAEGGVGVSDSGATIYTIAYICIYYVNILSEI